MCVMELFDFFYTEVYKVLPPGLILTTCEFV